MIMRTMKENWICPDVQVQVFEPNEYCAGCTQTVVIIDVSEPGYTWSWKMRDVTPAGLVVAADDAHSCLVPAPTNITYIHEIFGVTQSGSYYNLPGTSTKNGNYYTSTSYPSYTLHDSDGNGRIDSGDYLLVTVDGTQYSAVLNGSETAYSNPSAKYYAYQMNHS
jgi:hypothetical protein